MTKRYTDSVRIDSLRVHYQNTMNKQTIAFILGLIIALVAGRIYAVAKQHDHTHPVGFADSADEVHVHSGFLVHLAGETKKFDADKYQTTSMQTVHQHIHLHDNNGEIIHRHGHGVTMSDFFDSLGYIVTEDCITTDTAEAFCSTATEQLQFFVNGELTDDLANYVNQEEDRLLIFYGSPDDPIIPDLLVQISDEACIYSGTCPERGEAPPESCGVTCEL